MKTIIKEDIVEYEKISIRENTPILEYLKKENLE